MLLLKFLINYHLNRCISRKYILSTILKCFLLGFIFFIGLILPPLIKLNFPGLHDGPNLYYLKLIVIIFPFLIIIFPFNTPSIDYTYRIFPLTETQKVFNKIVLFILSWPGLSSLLFLAGVNVGLNDCSAILRVELFLCLALSVLLVQAVKQSLYYHLKLTIKELLLLIFYVLVAFGLVFWPFQNDGISLTLKAIVLITSCGVLIFIEHVSYLGKAQFIMPVKFFKYFWPLRTLSHNKIFPYYLITFAGKVIGLLILLLIGNVPFDRINSAFYLLLLMPIYTTSLTIDLWTQYGKFWVLAETISDSPIKVARKVYLKVVLVNFGFELIIACFWAILSHNFKFAYIAFYVTNILLTILLGYPLSLLSVKFKNNELQLNAIGSIIICNIFTLLLIFTISTGWFWITLISLLFISSIFFFSIPCWYRKRKYTIYLNLLRSTNS